MRRFDVDTIDAPRLLEETFIERASLDPNGRDMNGQICPLRDGSGGFISSEDTGQPRPPAGWGVFDKRGTQIGKLTATYFTAAPEPNGCAFDHEGRLFTTELGDQGSLSGGQLMVWFPPFDRFPGPPGDYPDTDEPSTNFCKIATDFSIANHIAIDGEGSVYVAESAGFQIRRYSPPFPTSPDAAGGCGATDALGSPVADTVNMEIFISDPANTVTPGDLVQNRSGNWYVASVINGVISEYDSDGNFIRRILEPPPGENTPFSTGNPIALTLAPNGDLYYADTNLVVSPGGIGSGPDGKIFRITFDEFGDPSPPQLIKNGLAFPDGLKVLPGDLEPLEWRTYAGGKRRHFFNHDEATIGADNVGDLGVKWAHPTDAAITASPSVARVNVPGEGRIPVAYILTWDDHLYALRLRNGSVLWSFATNVPPGVSYPNTASVHIERIDGADRLFFGSGQVFYSLDAVTGEEIWRFNAGTGCVVPGACDFDAERNEIESSAIIADGKVFFGMDINDREGGKGGFYALDVTDGRLAWFFDLESGTTCHPWPEDEIRKFDGYHSAEELGLPADFFATRPGCNFPRSPNGCGNVWSSPALDEERGMIFFASSNCDTDDDPDTLRPDPPMPPHDEAITALHLDGRVAWVWRPREVDNADLAFGGVPNLFTAVIDGAARDVVGVGNKDGTYYVIDREGENEISGIRWNDVDPSDLPYWRTKVVDGGWIGGIIATAAVDEVAGRIYFGTGIGTVFPPQRPTVHALDAGTGAVLWQNTAEVNADATYAPASAIGGVLFTGSIVGGFLRSYDATNGDKLGSVPLGSALASGTVVIDGLVLAGGGFGERNGNPDSLGEIFSRIPNDVTALCVPGTPACAEDREISGEYLKVSHRAASPRRPRLTVVSEDPLIAPPAPGRPADPRTVGAVLQIINPVSLEEQQIPLPASRWSALGKPPASDGYRYEDLGLADGPCATVRIKAGRIRAECRGEQLEFTLDEPQQEALAVAVKFANEIVYCMRFGGVVDRDFGTASHPTGIFSAKRAPAPPSCPLPWGS